MKISSYLPTKQALVQQLFIMAVGAVLAVSILNAFPSLKTYFDSDKD
jgi:hypothetical protein